MKRSREQVIWDFVQDWLHKAEGDIRASEHLLSMEQEDYFTAAFHAQQAAEKFLKAFLVWHQIPFPKTHDIEQLLQLAAQAEPLLVAELASVGMLTPFGIEFRYPSDEVADFEMAQQAVQEAKRVRAAVLERLNEYLNQGRPPAP
jgi:HEPN domain-containing protein